MEKNNDQAQRNYASSDHKNGPQEVLRTEARVEGLGLKRQKRKYDKVNTDYWEKTIFKNRRHDQENDETEDETVQD